MEPETAGNRPGPGGSDRNDRDGLTKTSDETAMTRDQDSTKMTADFAAAYEQWAPRCVRMVIARAYRRTWYDYTLKPWSSTRSGFMWNPRVMLTNADTVANWTAPRDPLDAEWCVAQETRIMPGELLTKGFGASQLELLPWAVATASERIGPIGAMKATDASRRNPSLAATDVELATATPGEPIMVLGHGNRPIWQPQIVLLGGQFIEWKTGVVDSQQPTASFGHVTDSWENNYRQPDKLRYTLAAEEDASGSPIINRDGALVGIHLAMEARTAAGHNRDCGVGIMAKGLTEAMDELVRWGAELCIGWQPAAADRAEQRRRLGMRPDPAAAKVLHREEWQPPQSETTEAEVPVTEPTATDKKEN